MSSIRIPSIVPPPLSDSVDLYTAFQGLGCNGPALIAILAHRSLEQRLQIKEAYGNIYKEDLMQRIKSELHFNFEKAVLLWMLEPPLRDAFILKDALRSCAPFSSSKRQRMLIEMLCLRSVDYLARLVQSYTSTFCRSLLDDVSACTDGFFRKLLEQYLSASHCKSDGAAINANKIASDGAQALFEATGRSSRVIDESAFFHILTTKSKPELLLIFDAYKQLYGKDLHKDIRKGPAEDSRGTIRDFI